MSVKLLSSGKVRDIYSVDNDKLLLVTSDRISAFDVNMPNTIHGKGRCLNLLSAFWFDFLKDVVPNHMLSVNNADMPAEFQNEAFKDRCMLVLRLKMLPVEAIVRGYLTGSAWSSYKKDGTMCGIQLPSGLVESERFAAPFFTPTTKASKGQHDENISFEQLEDLVGRIAARKIRDLSIAIFMKCSEYAALRGIIIADTKFEFGIDDDGNLVLADEVLTPDSSRFWPANQYQPGRSQPSFDKQYLRDWLKNSGWNKQPPAPQLPSIVIQTTAEKYAEAYERITGKRFNS